MAEAASETAPGEGYTAPGPGEDAVSIGDAFAESVRTKAPSKVEVLMVPSLRLVNARPTKSEDGIVNVADPTNVQAAPSGEA